MIAVLIGACVGTILGNAIFDKLTEKEDKIDDVEVIHRHKYYFTNDEKDVNVDEFIDKLKEAIKKNENKGSGRY